MQATIPDENIAEEVLKQATREKALGSVIGRGPWLNAARRTTLLHRELRWRDGGVASVRAFNPCRRLKVKETETAGRTHPVSQYQLLYSSDGESQVERRWTAMYSARSTLQFVRLFQPDLQDSAKPRIPIAEL